MFIIEDLHALNLSNGLEPKEEFKLVAFLYNEMRHCFEVAFPPRIVVHNVRFTGSEVVNNMINGHWRVCFDSYRMMPETLLKLCTILQARNIICDSRWVSVEE